MSEATDYRSVKEFSIGNPSLKIPRGALIQFDGYTMTLEGHPPMPMPTLRGAISAKWLVTQADFDAGAQAPRPQPAGITTRPADGGNPMDQKDRRPITTAQEEERHVGNVQEHANQVKTANNRVYSVAGVEDQDGVAVRHLGSPDGRKNPIEVTASNIGQAIRQAESRQIQPGQGRTREEIMAAMTPEQREQYQAEILARKSQHVALDERVVVKQAVIAGPEQQGHVVARIETQKTAEREGIKTTTTVGGGTDTVDIGGTGGQATVQEIESEGIKFTQTNGPKKSQQAETYSTSLSDDPRRVIAKSICSDFPDIYDFEASTKKKIARVMADFEDRPDVIRAVAAAETDAEMKTLLVQEFPEAFQG